mgnify:CR=1 FL=1
MIVRDVMSALRVWKRRPLIAAAAVVTADRADEFARLGPVWVVDDVLAAMVALGLAARGEEGLAQQRDGAGGGGAEVERVAGGRRAGRPPVCWGFLLKDCPRRSR